MVYLVALPNAVLSSQQGQNCSRVLKLQTQVGCGFGGWGALGSPEPGSPWVHSRGRSEQKRCSMGENEGCTAKIGAGAATVAHRRVQSACGQPAAGCPQC